MIFREEMATQFAHHSSCIGIAFIIIAALFKHEGIIKFLWDLYKTYGIVILVKLYIKSILHIFTINTSSQITIVNYLVVYLKCHR